MPTAVGALLLFALFRLPELTRYALWYDELFSITLGQMGWSDLFQAALYDRTNPPLFYALLKMWMAIGGDSVAWLRLLPCLIGIAVAWPLALLAQTFFSQGEAAADSALSATRSRAAAWTVVAIGAASPLLVFLSNELRGYSLALLLTTVSLLAAKRDRFGWMAVANTLLVYTHYFGWLVVLAQVGATFTWRRAALRTVSLAALLSGLAFAPWAAGVFLNSRVSQRPLSNVNWILPPDAAAVPRFFDALVARVLTPGTAWIGAVIVIGALLAAAATLARGHDTRRLRLAAELAWYAGLPVTVIYAASVVMARSAFVPRYLIIAAPAWWMLVAFAVTWSVGTNPPRRLTLAATAAFCAFTITAGALRLNRGGEKIGWDRIVSAISDDAGPAGGTVYTLEGFTAFPVTWYSRAQGTKLAVTSLPIEAHSLPAWIVVRSDSRSVIGAINRLVPPAEKATLVATERIPSQEIFVFRLSAR